MKASIVLSFLSLPALSSLVHGFVYPSTPIGATVWKPNTNATISWSDDKQQPLLPSSVFDVFLMTGADDHQIKLATIATNVRGDTTQSITYQVPYVSPPGQIYFLMFQTKDAKYTAWATRFTITDESGNRGTLRPTIPPGGKINPGGVGSIVAAPSNVSNKEKDKGNDKDKDKDKDQPKNGQKKQEPQQQQPKQGHPKEAAVGSNSEAATHGRNPVDTGSNGMLKAPMAPSQDGHSGPSSVGATISPLKDKSAHSGAASTALATASNLVIATLMGLAIMMNL
ncbi:hypothetical protein B0O80DRAFT_23296 [Mortierella sp. GBAus27b]|nr:hypothetical protein BGX31_000747 [Mortierella sp. GBA43]KAI8356265.1 hypothetical protein B0O80DRAFT_23296 [Mortierella sp. GBAus27b]